MEYFEALGLSREPFSSSPDPDMFFRSESQQECLRQLETAIRLRRGLNVVLGEAGTGKTALCRQLLRELAGDAGINASLISAPGPDDTAAFVARLAESLRVPAEEPPGSIHELMERIKSHLFDQGVARGRILCLLIDEGQTLRPECLEILRELLNYETNEFKLLQIAIFARTGFMDRLLHQPNLADRVNYLLALAPFTFRETKRMIAARLALAAAGNAPGPRLSPAALYLVHRRGQGCPGQVVQLCREALSSAARRGKKRAGLLDVPRAAGH
jgi:general secretion pathway protein A